MLPDFGALSDARRWYAEWLQAAALPLWSSAGLDADRGSFQESLTPDGRPAGSFRRARVQARQVWVFATAAQEGFGAHYEAVARRAFDAYQRHYQHSDGLFARAADADGRVTDPTPALYEQAFSLLAMAALEELGGGFGGTARRVRAALEAHRHGAGGWREAGDQPFQANAHMHLLEAALAWETAGEASWKAVSDEIVRLALDRFIDPATGAVREFFDADWRALEDTAGGLIEPGHQFEWAWLLSDWGCRRGDEAAQESARRLYAIGLRGLDAAREVAVGALWSDLSVREPTGRFWAQTEHLRAAVAFGTEAEALVAARGLARFLDTPAPGAWRDKLRADGTFVDEPAPATSLYHAVSGLLPLLR